MWSWKDCRTFPMDISRPTKCLMHRGAIFGVEFTSARYQSMFPTSSRRLINLCQSYSYDASKSLKPHLKWQVQGTLEWMIFWVKKRRNSMFLFNFTSNCNTKACTETTRTDETDCQKWREDGIKQLFHRVGEAKKTTDKDNIVDVVVERKKRHSEIIVMDWIVACKVSALKERGKKLKFSFFFKSSCFSTNIFAGIYFCKLLKMKRFVGTYFCKVGQNLQNLYPQKNYSSKVFD